ncbi:CubicO group peptidase, beta-lactamase class C family [Microbacterium sp. cf046]|uniref:serine hydrolase n=1 Tax=Microbacterium sp. cf046 TaxID=1761803 RepID=UPI0008F18481|nr:serine hydrolase domain-containing protein [Microbacterium sp. cf046]SFS14159.1 CubicO group peptidase, beta-lactamase class C family [Microbacterium sp. cf046]
MPGPGQSLKAGLREGISDELAASLNFDELATKVGRRGPERAQIEQAVGERLLGPPPSIDVDRVGVLSPAFRLDVDGFNAELLSTLSGRCHGFVYRLLVKGAPGLTVQSGWARDPAEGDVRWHPDVRMHVASVSKMITAMAAVKALSDAAVPMRTAIWPWLPLYWQPRGPNIERVTFEMLLTHESGLWHATSDEIDFDEVKANVYRGALLGVPLGDEKYQNVNFSLFRILIPVLTGAIKPSMTAPGGGEEETDRLWDALTIQAYGDYVRDNVFAPAAVVDARTASGAGDALSYRWPTPAGGRDSGDLSGYSATIAWHLSANELGRVLQAFADGSVVGRKRMHRMLDGGWGIDQAGMTRAGPYFLKGGWWEGGTNQVVQAVAGLLPGELPFAVLVNSALVNGAPTPAPVSLMSVVMAAVKAHVAPAA